MRIAILGAESTGKSTLCYALADKLNAAGTPAVVVDEYLREWCNTAQRTPRPAEQASIAREQLRRTRVPHEAVLFADTTALMTAVYSDVLFSDRRLYPMGLADLKDFRHVLVTATDLPWVADGYLRDSPQGQQAVHRRLQEVLRQGAIPYSVVYGDGERRLQAALAIVMPALAETHADAETYQRWLTSCEKCSDPVCEHRMFRSLLDA